MKEGGWEVVVGERIKGKYRPAYERHPNLSHLDFSTYLGVSGP